MRVDLNVILATVFLILLGSMFFSIYLTFQNVRVKRIFFFNSGKSFIKLEKLLHFYEIPLFVEQLLKFYLHLCTKYIWHHIYPTPPLEQDMTQGQFFKRSLTGLNSEFSFSKTSCLTKAEEPSLSYYLPIAGGTIIGFILFPRVLVLCENAISPIPATITITPRAQSIYDMLQSTEI